MTRTPLIRARSMSSRVDGILHSGSTGRVLASFERACTLVTDGGEIATLAWNGIGNGPLNVVIEAKPCPSPPVGLRFGVSSGGKLLSVLRNDVGEPILLIDLSSARQWNPRPDWRALHPQRRRVLANAAVVAEITEETRHSALQATVQSRLKQTQGDVCAAHHSRDQKALQVAIERLCGAGEGLTPAGDDWLAGWLLALWLTNPSDSSRPAAGLGSATDLPKPQVYGNGRRFSEQRRWAVGSIGSLILEIARERTTFLSRAFLACAAAGEADESWHTLLREMAHLPQDVPAIARETRRILSHGATSGAAMLTGFLAGLNHPTAP